MNVNEIEGKVGLTEGQLYEQYLAGTITEDYFLNEGVEYVESEKKKSNTYSIISRLLSAGYLLALLLVLNPGIVERLKGKIFKQKELGSFLEKELTAVIERKNLTPKQLMTYLKSLSSSKWAEVKETAEKILNDSNISLDAAPVGRGLFGHGDGTSQAIPQALANSEHSSQIAATLKHIISTKLDKVFGV